MKLTKNDTGGSKKPYKTWSKSSRSDGFSKELRVEEIENGFIVILDEYGEKNGKYTSNCRKYYSEENPLADDDLVMDTGLEDAITNFIKGI